MNPQNLEKDWYAVNCYDMSAAVQTCLSLGVPYHTRDSNGNQVNWVNPNDKSKSSVPMQNLGTAFIWPFGYMKELDLIGWGKSNSPFFNNSNVMIMQPLPNGNVSPDRQGFKNHAWVYYRKDNTAPANLYAMDACAGPTSTPVTMAEYITAAVDETASSSSGSKYTGVSTATPQVYPGVSNVMADGADFFEATTPLTGDSHFRLTYQTMRVFINNVGPSVGYNNIKDVLGTTNCDPIPVPISGLVRSALNTAAEATGATPPADSTPVPIPPNNGFSQSSTSAYGPFSVKTAPSTISKDGSVLKYHLRTASCCAPYLTITIYVLEDLYHAFQWLVTQLDMCTHSTDAVWALDPGQVEAGKIILQPQSSPNVPIGAIVRGNLFVSLSGTADNTTITNVLNAMDTFIGNYVNGDVSPTVLTQSAPPLNQTLSLKQEFNLNIQVSGLALYDQYDLILTHSRRPTLVKSASQVLNR